MQCIDDEAEGAAAAAAINTIEVIAGAFGAGLAGVVLGIAAQQSLGNVFASVVLLLARPFSVGERIRIRSGALGGIFDATVLGISLTYVTVRTDDGLLKIPNSVMLATAAGPIPPSEEEPAKDPAPSP